MLRNAQQKRLIPFLFSFIILFLVKQWLFAQSNTLLKLWYNQPAKQWVEALPVGNGRLGSMVYGDPYKERIQLNENTVWAGQPHRNDNPDAREALEKVRQLIFTGRYKEAQDLVNRKFISRNSQGMPYQTAGNLDLSFPGHESYTNYYRELNIETAVTTTRYDVDGVTYNREVFASFPDQVIVFGITASKPGRINFTTSMNRPAPVEISTEGNNQLILSGVTSDRDSIKGAVKFYLSFLVEEPQQKWLVVCPSVSPENAPSSHPESSIAAGTTMDNQILFDLFTKTIKSAEILKTDEELVKKIKDALIRLPPMQIGQWGQLQEWMHDWDSQEDKHRHVSHLYGLFPSNQISPYRTPELFSAAKRSLIARGDESTGWSMGWKINLWARLLDGNHALKLITDQLTPSIQSDGKQKGGTYPNMFDAHPPFQIDGNFGFTAGVAGMLMQSDDGCIDILPALPDVWKKGSVSGLRTRGGFEISNLAWENGQLSKLVIKSNLGGNCRIRTYSPIQAEGDIDLKPAVKDNPNPFYKIPKIKEPLISKKARLDPIQLRQTFVYDLPTQAGKVYTFIPIDSR